MEALVRPRVRAQLRWITNKRHLPKWGSSKSFSAHEDLRRHLMAQSDQQAKQRKAKSAQRVRDAHY